MILITSASFIVSDLQAEFGRIPSSFIPLAHHRLYELQHQLVSQAFPDERIFLSLPRQYDVPKSDLRRLEELGISIIRSDGELSLAESVRQSMERMPLGRDPVRVLHGDSLFLSVPTEVDVINVSVPSSQQDWFMEDEFSSDNLVWSGYFAFSHSTDFLEALANESDFESCVLLYDKKHPMVRKENHGWQDFGHMATYYLARQGALVTRTNNALKHKNGFLEKTGQSFKIKAEHNWYMEVPFELEKFIPKVISGSGGVERGHSYLVEYLPLCALNEILVFGNQRIHFWSNIFVLFSEFLNTCGTQARSGSDQSTMQNPMSELHAHVSKRLELLEHAQGPLPLDLGIRINGKMAPSIRQIASHCLAIVGESDAVPAVIHGDLCLGNVLFEGRLNQIRVIDPRGLDFEGNETIYGDQRYDLAKLAQSFIGQYDWILANRFDLELDLMDDGPVVEFHVESSDLSLKVADKFLSVFLEDKVYRDEVLALMILLFITMGPFHSESPGRQLAFLVNSASLFNRFFGHST